jgi:hypothetical protein
MEGLGKTVLVFLSIHLPKYSPFEHRPNRGKLAKADEVLQKGTLHL